MKKLIFILTLAAVFVASQVVFAQDKPVEKKVEKVVKKGQKSECKSGKDKKCCDKSKGKKCDGKCCDKCKEKCMKEGKKECAKDSTACIKKHSMKKMGKKEAKAEKPEVKTEEPK